ncbi:sensor histidine kinase [Glaciecola sp. 1036]|uniref:sensor histidine kinase n=1 Tax=Alteromonadaceae TaxID=72275 RepID=UPI003D071055
MLKNLKDNQEFFTDFGSMRYWQVAFWGFLGIVTFFTLTLWYSQASVIYVIPTIIQSVLGLIFSHILQYLLVYFWQTNLWFKSVINVILVAIVSLAWTFARMWVFQLITGESHIWNEFGGWYFSSIFIFVSWTAVFYGVQYYRLLQEKKKDMLNAEAAAREARYKRVQAQATARDAQLQMLRYQLNPHFLCNTLNAINALIEVEENEKAQMMTVNLSQFLRYSLDNIPDGKIPLQQEVDILWLYLKIEKTRFEDRLQVVFDVETECEQAFVPSLILQPLIENCMKHAIAKSESGGTIKISAKKNRDLLELMVEDTGSNEHTENEKAAASLNKGVGLENTNQRLDILYAGEYKITVTQSQLGGLKTLIQLPFETEDTQIARHLEPEERGEQ